MASPLLAALRTDAARKRRFWWPSALLVVESVALALRFDGEGLAHSPSTALRVFAALAGAASPFVVSLAAAAILVGSDRWRAELRTLIVAGPPRHPLLWWLLQPLSFGVFYLLCRQLFEGARPEMHTVPWLALWFLCGAATLVTWLALLAPWSAVVGVTWRTVSVVSAGGALGAAAYLAGRATQGVWEPLRRCTLAVVAPLVSLTVPGARFDAADWSIQTERFAIVIDSRCSGYEGLGLTAVFVAAFFWLFRDRLRFPRVLLLAPLALTTIWLLNAVRIAALVAVGHHISSSLAVGGFHSYIGSALFSAVNLLLLFGTLRSRTFTVEPSGEAGAAGALGKPSAAPVENPVAPYLLPFLGFVAAALISSALATDGARAWYPARIAVAAVLLWHHRRRLAQLLQPRLLGRDWGWALLVGTAAFLLWVAASRSPVEPAPRPSSLVFLWWTVRVAGAVLVVPLVEELAFRGYVLRRLTGADVDAVSWERVPTYALLVGATLFAALHPQNVLGGLVAGLAYGWVLRRRRTLMAAVVAHACTNALVFAWAAATGRWGLL